jgi:hypothetical protein
MTTEATAVATTEAQAQTPEVPDTSHLIVEITQECYDEVKGIVERATERGLDSRFENWLCRLAIQHVKVQEKLWDNSDDASILKRAKAGNKQAQLAILATIGLKLDAEKMQAFFASMK